jgi:hypothetical protein
VAIKDLSERDAPAFGVTGLTGATAASRYAGAIASGTAPSSGTFAAGDWIIVRTGGVIICTAGGSPGTWAAAGGSGGLSTGLAYALGQRAAMP